MKDHYGVEIDVGDIVCTTTPPKAVANTSSGPRGVILGLVVGLSELMARVDNVIFNPQLGGQSHGNLGRNINPNHLVVFQKGNQKIVNPSQV